MSPAGNTVSFIYCNLTYIFIFYTKFVKYILKKQDSFVIDKYNSFADIVNKPHVDKKELIIRHLDTLLEFHNEKYVLVNFRKHLVCYAKGVIGGKELKKKAFEALSINELKTIIQESNL